MRHRAMRSTNLGLSRQWAGWLRVTAAAISLLGHVQRVLARLFLLDDALDLRGQNLVVLSESGE
jgi:hypothetical protein